MSGHCVIKTSRIHTSVTERALKLYFQKWQREGYTVTDVYINKDDEAASVHFKECNLKPDLLKRLHKIGGVTFSTSLYPEWLKLPPPFSLQDLDPQKIRFLKDSEKTRSDFEKKLHDIYTTFEFDSESSVILTCCLTKDVPNADHRANAWESEVRGLCEEFFGALSTEQVGISPKIWSDVITAIADLEMPNRDEAVLHIHQELKRLLVVGHKIIAEPLMQVLKTIKEKATNDYRYRTDLTTVATTVISWQLRLLEIVDFEGLMSRKYPNLKTELVFDKSEIILSGVMCDVEAARKDLGDAMLAFRQERLSVLPEEKIKFKLVQKRSVREYIEKKLENVKGFFETGNYEVKVYSLSEYDSSRISDIFTYSLREQVISLDPESVPLVESAEWKKLCCDLTRPHGDFFEITVGQDRSHVVVAATDDVIEDVTKDVKTIINNKSVYRDTIQFNIRCHRFLTTYRRTDIDKLERLHAVEILENTQIFSLKGTKYAVKSVKQELKTLSEAIVYKRYMFNSPGIVKLLMSEKGRTQIQHIMASERCFIEPEYQKMPTDVSGETLQAGNNRRDDMTRSVPGSDDHTLTQRFTTPVLDEGRSPRDNEPPDAGAELSPPFEIVIIDEDITKQQTDVIVNSASGDLQLRNGSVSSSILKAGGEDIQQECNNNGIEPGEFAITGGGKLRCKHVYHACLPDWNEEAHKVLRKVMLDCLQRASLDTHKTIAFPALGTGILRYPTDVVAQIMIQTAQQFGQNNPECSLKKVSIVVYNDDATIFEAFQRVKEATEEEMKRKITFITRRNNRDFDIDAMEGTTRESAGTQTSQPATQVTLHLYSDDIRHVETAFKRLDTFCKDDITRQRISDDIMKTMDQQQQDKIRKLRLKHSVSVDLNHMTGAVELEGLKQDVMEALGSVHTICKDILIQRTRDEKARLISSYVRWGYTDLSGTCAIRDYDKITNLKIEEAYMAKLDSLCLAVIDGSVYALDFKKMEEIDLNNPEDRVRVVRKDLSEGTIFETPSYWSPMMTEWKMIELEKETSEYRKVEEAFSNSVGRQTTVLKIERVQAQLLWKLYVMKRHHMQKKQKQNPDVTLEKVLWHGTSVDAIPCIAKNGFNRGYSGKNATTFGKGVYFAVRASVSDKYSVPDSQDHKHMFQTRVLTGNYYKGTKETNVPKMRDSQNQTLYDSVVDNTEAPAMFIIFHDAQAYPEYHITYIIS